MPHDSLRPDGERHRADDAQDSSMRRRYWRIKIAIEGGKAVVWIAWKVIDRWT